MDRCERDRPGHANSGSEYSANEECVPATLCPIIPSRALWLEGEEAVGPFECLRPALLAPRALVLQNIVEHEASSIHPLQKDPEFQLAGFGAKMYLYSGQIIVRKTNIFWTEMKSGLGVIKQIPRSSPAAAGAKYCGEERRRREWDK